MRLAGRLSVLVLCVTIAMPACERSTCIDTEPEHEVITLLFRDCWGVDPYGGCGYNHYSYFECDENACRHVGDWPEFIQDTDPPSWWDDANVGLTCYLNRTGCLSGLWGDERDLSKTPRPDREAEEAALWLSESLVAPEAIYARLHTVLARVRGKYGDYMPKLRTIEFRSPWFVSFIEIALSEEAWEQYQRGEYHDLDSLNVALGLSSMDHMVEDRFTLRFNGVLHPRCLAELYQDVTSVRAAEALYILYDSPCMIPWVVYREK